MAISVGSKSSFYSAPSIVWGIGLVLVGGVAGGFLFGRKPRPTVVFVKTAEVMARYKGAIKGRETFQKETAVWEDESKKLETQLRDLAKTVKPNDGKAMDQARQLRSRLESLREKAARRDQELMAPVIAEINANIKKFAQKQGYTLVLGTLQGGVVLHGEDEVDVTEPLLAEMNR